MQTENSNRNLPKTLIVLCKLKTVTETCPKINCIMQTKTVTETCVKKMNTENSNRNLSKPYIVLCNLKTVTETCLKNKLYYANCKR